MVLEPVFSFTHPSCFLHCSCPSGTITPLCAVHARGTNEDVLRWIVRCTCKLCSRRTRMRNFCEDVLQASRKNAAYSPDLVHISYKNATKLHHSREETRPNATCSARKGRFVRACTGVHARARTKKHENSGRVRYRVEAPLRCTILPRG